MTEHCSMCEPDRLGGQCAGSSNSCGCHDPVADADVNKFAGYVAEGLDADCWGAIEPGCFDSVAEGETGTADELGTDSMRAILKKALTRWRAEQ